jgi:DNA-directed RNA polymerase specialized sigma24 family protein
VGFTVVSASEAALAAGSDPGWSALARVARGETEAFAELIERHQERLLRLCEGLLGDLEEARDAAQDVFIKA